MSCSRAVSHQDRLAILRTRFRSIVQQYATTESMWNTLLVETKLNLLAGNGAIRILCRALFEKGSTWPKLMKPIVLIWESEFQHAEDMIECLAYRVDQDWLNYNETLFQSCDEVLDAARDKASLLLRSVNDMGDEETSERVWREFVEDKPQLKKTRMDRHDTLVRVWSKLFIYLEDHEKPENLSDLELTIDRVLRKCAVRREKESSARFNGSQYIDAAGKVWFDYPGSRQAPYFGKHRSEKTDARPGKTDARPGETDAQSGRTNAQYGRTDAQPEKTDAPFKKTHSSRFSAQYPRSFSSPGRTETKHSPSTEEKAGDKQSKASDAQSSKRDSKLRRVDTKLATSTEEKASKTQEKATSALKRYNERWDKLGASSSAIPFPTVWLEATAISNSRLIVSGRGTGLPWTAEEIATANVQAFFLLELEIKPKYWMDRKKIRMGFSENTGLDRVESLRLQMKKERFRWHPDRLGARNDGKEEVNARLRDDRMAKIVRNAVQSLYDEACSRSSDLGQ